MSTTNNSENAALNTKENLDEICNHTQSIIDGMEFGSRIETKDIVDQVISKFSGAKKGNIGHITHMVKMYIKQHKDVKVEVGRMGGTYKGGKPVRIDARPRCETCHQVLRPKLKKETEALDIDSIDSD